MYGGHNEEETYDEWGFHNSAYVTVDFLLPTGIYIPLKVERNSTIKMIKKQLWDEAINYPLFGQLTTPDMYVFLYVTGIGTTEEIVTETKRLCEIELLIELPMLKLVKRQGNIEEKKVAQEIKTLAGIKNEDEINKDPEKAHFRTKMRKRALEVVYEREKMHWKELLQHHYPPSLIPYLNPNTHILREFGVVPVKYENNEGMTKKMKVNPSWTSEDLTKEALQTFIKSGNKPPTTNPEDYVLRGPNSEYIVGKDIKLFEYKLLRASLVKRVNTDETNTPHTPVLILEHVATVRAILPQSTFGFEQLKLVPLPPPMPKRRTNTISLWHLDYMFSVKVVRTGNLNTKTDRALAVHIGLYHGISPLCNTCYTKDTKDQRGNECIWEDSCYFDINTCNLPRNSRLCIAICTIDKRATKKKEKSKNQDNGPRIVLPNATPLFWVNMNVFDFQGMLKSGKHKLACWGWPDNLENDNLNPLGVVTTNPDEDSAPFVEISLAEYQSPVAYPPFQDVMAEAARQASLVQKSEVLQKASKTHMQQLEEMLMKPPQEELFENEKELLWYLRLECRDNYPGHLAKILSAVKWNSFKHVAQMQALLNSWGDLEPERALELLDCQYADEKVREFAVNCLKNLADEQLQQYLLQLVQVVKFESYLDTPLVFFLLERAWKNRKIGHFLFWHLKSEMSNLYVGNRFSLILEAYLYGNTPHVELLHRQHDALMKMKSLNELVKSPEILQKDIPTRGRQALQTCITNQESYTEALSQVECPLDPSIVLGKIDTRPCKVMNSKMRPLWLVFDNPEDAAEKISVIYKNGDDLRQDMLTLQIISIMDMMWKSEGLDLRVIPYGCLSTGDKTGMIEVVTHANTIANIQKKRGGRLMSAFRHESLFEWIQSNNKTPQEFETAIQNFTYSCAGYCVATYVLGVGDRHSDNIMVTEKGQLFHIDFGHILGNFKTKFGIKRERVPFVIAHDFVHVINKGKTDTKEEFEKFRKLCDRAFLILRKKGYLFITLFSLMLSSGLPELTSLSDLDYLRESLALRGSEQQATKQFHNKFNKALKDAWSTSVNWFFHNVAKDNT